MQYRLFGEKREGAEYIKREGAYIICIRDGCVAASKAAKGYYLPGGGVKNGESHEECISRECIEETGYSVRAVEKIAEAEIFFENGSKGNFHLFQNYYRGEFIKKEKEPIETDVVFEWLPLENTDKMVVDGQKWAVRVCADIKS